MEKNCTKELTRAAGRENYSRKQVDDLPQSTKDVLKYVEKVLTDSRAGRSNTRTQSSVYFKNNKANKIYVDKSERIGPGSYDPKFSLFLKHVPSLRFLNDKRSKEKMQPKIGNY